MLQGRVDLNPEPDDFLGVLFRVFILPFRLVIGNVPSVKHGARAGVAYLRKSSVKVDRVVKRQGDSPVESSGMAWQSSMWYRLGLTIASMPVWYSSAIEVILMNARGKEVGFVTSLLADGLPNTVLVFSAKTQVHPPISSTQGSI